MSVVGTDNSKHEPRPPYRMADPSGSRPKRNSRQEPPDNGSAYDKLTKPELVGIQNYNEAIIRSASPASHPIRPSSPLRARYLTITPTRDHFTRGVEVSKSPYLQQVLQEQQQIEARLQLLEQQPDERDAYLQSLPPLPEYILSVKARAASRPVVSNNKWARPLPPTIATFISRTKLHKSTGTPWSQQRHVVGRGRDDRAAACPEEQAATAKAEGVRCRVRNGETQDYYGVHVSSRIVPRQHPT